MCKPQSSSKRTNLVLFRGVSVLFLLFVIGGCAPQPESFQLATGPPGSLYDQLGRALKSVWEQHGGICLEASPDPKADPLQNCRRLALEDADFALVSDDAPLDLCIDPTDPKRRVRLRAIAPLFPEILFIVKHPSLPGAPLPELLKGRRVGFGVTGTQSYRFGKKVLQAFGVHPRTYTPDFTPLDSLRLSEELPLVVVLAATSDPRLHELLRQGGQLVSLDDPATFGHGSRTEGFAQSYLRAHPVLLPAGAVGLEPAQPQLTLGIDILLVTHEEVDATQVFDLTRTLFEHQQELTNQYPLFYQLTESFDVHTLEFPLHPGALQYYSRDNPTFLERYAEVVALLVTLVLLAYGGISGISRWLRQRKKERIDTYYIRVLDIERRGRDAETAGQLDDLIEELLLLKQEAIERLVDEKLTPDDSFRIFESLATNNLTTLRYRKERLPAQP